MAAQQEKPISKRKIPRKATPRYLENAALYYLERFATSVENLRRVLMRKVERSAHHHGADRDEGARIVDDLIGRFLKLSLLDDRLYSEGKVRAFRRQGNSTRSIRAKLLTKGVPFDVIEDTLMNEVREGPNPELAAASRLARRRRLGPWRDSRDRTERREKDLAALGRAGFSYDVALRIIDAETAED
ncbi:MAG TPA: RecX family transcriptional regulator, partial [Rhodospirillales bacterium]|nr:RecX family transcriptional regulator [Rhodospirillales bacterium]